MAEYMTTTGQTLPEKDAELVRKAYDLFGVFREDMRPYHEQARVARQIALIRDPEQDVGDVPPEARTTQMHTLRSTLVNCIADQMDNMPEAMIAAETPERQPMAEGLTDVCQYIQEHNEYDAIHRQRVEDFYVTGTSVLMTGWDAEMMGGMGNVFMLRCPVESIYFDPQSGDLDGSRAVFRATYHPRSYYESHFPNEAKYVHSDVYTIEDDRQTNAADEESILLLEYWYRTYDAEKGRYHINVAYLAGGALLDRHDDVYLHGMYPFVVDVFTRIEGKCYGQGMMTEFAPLQRMVNRYARYMDENARITAKQIMLMSKSAGISPEDMADLSQQIKLGENVGENVIRFLQVPPLSPYVMRQMLQYQEDIKNDSGQNQFSRGEGASGITAASAISAMQEAGGKTTRLRTDILNSGFRRMTYLSIWLVHQYMQDNRRVLVTGADGKNREAVYTRAMTRGDGPDAPPPYSVRIQVQKKNPTRIQAENDLLMSLYNVFAQSKTPISPMAMLNALQVDGKDRIRAAIEEDEARQREEEGKDALIAQLQQQQQALVDKSAQDVGALQQILRMQGSEAQAANPAGAAQTEAPAQGVSALGA